MSEPKQKPGKSKQDYGTPWAFIRAVEKRWGPLAIDLAARADNAKAPRFITPEADSLSSRNPWSPWCREIAWLNPEFADIAPWAAKCAANAEVYRAGGGRIIMLTPASIGSEWFEAHVHRKAMVIGLRPRLTFEGTSDPYPKDLMLSIFGEAPGFDTWRWDRESGPAPAQAGLFKPADGSAPR